MFSFFIKHGFMHEAFNIHHTSYAESTRARSRIVTSRAPFSR